MGAVGEVRRAVGEGHAEKAAASTLHSKPEPGSDEEKVNGGVGSLMVPVGPEVIVVPGGFFSTEIRVVVPAERS